MKDCQKSLEALLKRKLIMRKGPADGLVRENSLLQRGRYPESQRFIPLGAGERDLRASPKAEVENQVRGGASREGKGSRKGPELLGGSAECCRGFWELKGCTQSIRRGRGLTGLSTKNFARNVKEVMPHVWAV